MCKVLGILVNWQKMRQIYMVCEIYPLEKGDKFYKNLVMVIYISMKKKSKYCDDIQKYV